MLEKNGQSDADQIVFQKIESSTIEKEFDIFSRRIPSSKLKCP